MDERLRSAAQSGDIDDLYTLIQDDADVLRRIDEMEFVDTPLHIAAAAGHTDFAMMMMNLKPSFATKLNQRGFSPLHLALQNEQKEMVLDLISIDKDLVRVKGREGYTPLHYAAREGYILLLPKFLEHCPSCIFDLTIRKETVLHVAAQNDKLEAFEIILLWIEGNGQYVDLEKRRILNLQDKDGNTVLHIAASKRQHQMIKLLIESKKVDRNTVNQRDFTALQVLQEQAPVDRESVNTLIRAEDEVQAPSKFPWVRYFAKFERDIQKMKPYTINALLVVFALILGMSYQAVFSPPDSVFQADAGSSTKDAGKSVISPSVFAVFYFLNSEVFMIAWVVTFLLLRVVGKSVVPIVYALYFLTCSCVSGALGIIGPASVWMIWVVASIISALFVLCF